MARNPEIVRVSVEPCIETEREVRKYEIIIEAEGADDLPTLPGTEVCFVWRRYGKVCFSESSEVWDDGIVYWDAKCMQVATMRLDGASSFLPKPCEFLVQTVSINDEGLPSGLGAIIASTKIDLAEFCSRTNQELHPEADLPRMVLPLEPSGSLTIRVGARRVLDVVPGLNDDVSESEEEPSERPLTPDSRSSSRGRLAELPVLSLDAKFSSAAASPSPLESRKSCTTPIEEDAGKGLDAPVSAFGIESPIQERKEEEEDRPGCCSESYVPLAQPPPPGTFPSSPTSREISPSPEMSSALAPGSTSSRSCSGGADVDSVSALQRRCVRLSKERDEARAQAFAEASNSVQRGIEIESLKRAKDVLLQRLETTERQLMMLMRMDADYSPSAHNSVADDWCERGVGGGGGGNEILESDTIVQALVDAKISVAQKEFEVMDLQGKVRARDAHIEALTDHLTAIRAAAETEKHALATLRKMRPRSATPPTMSPGQDEQKSSSPVVHIYAHAGVSN